MNAVLTPSAKQEIRFDSRLPSDRERLTDAADAAEDWNPTIRANVTDEDILNFIEELANTGYYPDELGQMKKADPLYYAAAQHWADDPLSLRGYIYTAFHDWATAATKLAKWGK